MRNKIMLAITTCILFAGSHAIAQLQWRVSVKFILDAGGNRPANGPINTNAEVQAYIDTANTLLAGYGRGYRFNLTEIVDLPGVSQWFDVNVVANRGPLETAALADPTTYAWRTDAINVYINGHCCSGAVCAFPPGSHLIFFSQASPITLMLHEIGHYFNLCHTHGCPNGPCDMGPAGDDDIDDTIGDKQCWTQDDIAMNAFGVPYTSLTAEQQERVNDVFKNIMSYHGPQDRLTPDQLDRMTCVSNSDRINVATGRTRIVGSKASGEEECSTPSFLYSTFSSALTAADDGDIILFRDGTRTFTGTINKPVTLRTSRGTAVIGP